MAHFVHAVLHAHAQEIPHDSTTTSVSSISYDDDLSELVEVSSEELLLRSLLCDQDDMPEIVDVDSDDALLTDLLHDDA